MKRLGFVALAFAALSAETTPTPGGVDPHIQRVMFEPDQVVSLQGAIGWQIMLEFGPDERIENVSIGDSLAWLVTPNKRATMLFLKPLIRGGSTNMTVVTSQRHYAFALSTGMRGRSIPWIVGFDYPVSEPEAVAEPTIPAVVKLSFAYNKEGDPEVIPTRVWDDGRQTYFEFAPDMPMPAIFAGGVKDELLVNVATRGRIQVVQQLGRRFNLRLGTRRATVTRISQ